MAPAWPPTLGRPGLPPAGHVLAVDLAFTPWALLLRPDATQGVTCSAVGPSQSLCHCAARGSERGSPGSGDAPRLPEQHPKPVIVPLLVASARLRGLQLGLEPRGRRPPWRCVPPCSRLTGTAVRPGPSFGRGPPCSHLATPPKPRISAPWCWELAFEGFLGQTPSTSQATSA